MTTSFQLYSSAEADQLLATQSPKRSRIAVDSQRHQSHVRLIYFHSSLQAFIYRLPSDLSSTHLSTLHKDTFRGLTHLTVLDLSKNRLDFLPNDLLLDLDSLANLWVAHKAGTLLQKP
jgi:hypothetical protein